ncbi:MAG: GNAT family N-acetyltransferase [Clostridiaceae bacterium]|nr:GNAT family N-acetyltransferase [Clostridiaceae bacterium]
MIEIEEIPVERINEFWEKHIKYLVDDQIVTDPKDIEYFSGPQYRDTIKAHMLMTPDRLHMVYFLRDGVRIGATQFVTFKSEDGKCLILDFWVFPEFRGGGTGHRCFEALERYTREDGAAYFEINCEKEASVRFWKSLGFVENGVDEYGMPLFIRK